MPPDATLTSSSTSEANTIDLEKQDTEAKPIHDGAPRPNVTRTRTSRTQTLTRRTINRNRFSHTLSHVKTTEAEIVDFDGEDDPYRPLNWPFRKKVITTLLYGLTTMGSTWATSVYSPATQQISDEFGVSEEVATLGTTLLILGFAFGPLLFAPLSEIYGRRKAVLVPYFFAVCFSFGTAAAKDIQTILITRFFTGIFASAPVTNTGGVLADIWSPRQRGNALVGYAFAVLGGPTLGPIAGGAIVSSYLRWRWTQYITGIFMAFILFLDVLILDETFAPALLVYKARRLRHDTGNWALHARHEEWDVGIKEMINKFFLTPFRLLATPICFLVALYASFVYGILYLCLGAIPIQFGESRGWGPVTSELPFLAILFGFVLGGIINVLYICPIPSAISKLTYSSNNKLYIRAFEANGHRAVPEARLPPMMLGSIFFAAGLFIFGWTSPTHIHWIAPVIGLVSMGFGFLTIFQNAINYLIDTFQKYSASAIAANTFLRSVFAGAFPLIVSPMFHNLGIPWASSLLGFIAVALIPIPFLFYIYGSRIRQKGKYTAQVMCE